MYRDPWSSLGGQGSVRTSPKQQISQWQEYYSGGTQNNLLARPGRGVELQAALK